MRTRARVAAHACPRRRPQHPRPRQPRRRLLRQVRPRTAPATAPTTAPPAANQLVVNWSSARTRKRQAWTPPRTLTLTGLSAPGAIARLDGDGQSAAYAYSSAAAFYIAERFGRKRFLRLYDAFNDPKLTEPEGAELTAAAVRSTLGISLLELERDLRRWIVTRAVVDPSRLSSDADARAARGRDDPPPPGAPRRGAHARARSRSSTRAGAGRSRRAELADAVEGRTVERLGRRGKYLVWELEDDVYLLLHLRMTGHAAARPARAAAAHARAGSSSATTGSRSPTRAASAPASSRSATEALRRVLRRAARRRAARATTSPASTCTRSRARSRAPIKAFLLDQKRVAGVGNIYADEALFRARIHPLRPAEPAHARAVRGAARRGRRVAGGRDRGQGRHDRRLPRPRRRQRLLPGPVPRSTCARASRA